MTLTIEPIVIRDKAFTPKSGSHQPNGEGAEIDASIEDGLALLDAMLGAVPA